MSKTLKLLAAAMLTVSAAHAGPAKMPEAMIGRWCPVKGEYIIYYRTDDMNLSRCIEVGPDTYNRAEAGCIVQKVTRSASAYRVTAECTGEGENAPTRTVRKLFRLSCNNEWLEIR